MGTLSDCETTSPNYPGSYFDLVSNEFDQDIASVSFYYMSYGPLPSPPRASALPSIPE